MPNLNDYHGYKSTNGGSSNGVGTSGGPRRGFWVVIGILVALFVVSGASWKAIETLLALGFIAYLFFR